MPLRIKCAVCGGRDGHEGRGLVRIYPAGNFHQSCKEARAADPRVPLAPTASECCRTCVTCPLD